MWDNKLKRSDEMLHLLCPNPALDRTLITESYNKGAANRPIEVKDFPGGKSFNVAYAIQQTRYNTPFTIHTILGGYFGDYVEELAKNRDVPLIKTPMTANTRICSIVVDNGTNEVYPLYEKGHPINEPVIDEYTKNLLENIQPGDTVALSGSFLPGFPINYIQILGENLKAKNVDLCVDTSGDALKEAFALQPKLIKINDEELLDIFPQFNGNTVENYIDFFKKEWTHLTEYFVVTLGKEGVLAKMQKNLYYLKSKQIVAKNPIASGDFFFGTLLANIKNGKSPSESLKSAISASTANCLNWYPEFTIEQFNDIKENYITLTEIEE